MADPATTTPAPPKPPAASPNRPPMRDFVAGGTNAPMSNSPPGALAGEPAEETPQQRLEALLVSMKANYEHNAPVAPAHITELEALVALGRGDKPSVASHPFGKYVLVAKPDGTAAVVWTAEQALDFVRALPDDVRNRPYWVVAEKLLLSAIDSTGDVTAAQAQIAFDDAISKDRAVTAIDRPADERLPDGRIREDRFPDRRPPAPPSPTAAAPQPAA